MISPTRNEIIKSLVDYIELATGLARDKIIRGNQNAPAPTGSYCTLLYTSDSSPGTSNIDLRDIDPQTFNYISRSKRNYTYSIQFYRDGATDLAKSLMMFSSMPAGKEFQQVALFTINSIELLSSSSVVMSNNYEERAILSANIIVAETLESLVNKVASIEIDLSSESGTVINEIIEVI